MAEPLPEPLVPADVDLRGMPWMPVDTVRLLDSDLFALSTGDEFKAAVALWCKAWQQKPAGSLPSDDRVLAHLSGAKQWKKVKSMAMRGFLLRRDGRWYHPVIADKALEAWQRREDWQDAQENKQTRQQRWRQRLKEVSKQLREAGVPVPAGASLETLERLLGDAVASTHASTSPSTQASTGASASASTVDASETGRTGTGTGTGTLKPKSGEALSSSERARDPDLDPEKPRASPASSPSAILAVTLRRLGCQITPSHPLAVQWATEGVTTETVTRAMAIARDRPGKADGNIPPAYLAKIIAELLNPTMPTNPVQRQPESDWQPPEVRNAAQ